jgi:hypothetical protein
VPSAVRVGFNSAVLPANDDQSTGPASLAFSAPINFFGSTYSSLYVNNNGNVTFGNASSGFNPSALTSPGDLPRIAPFFADVDTRGIGSGLVTYGVGVVGGRAAFGVNWPNVGYYNQNADKLDNFQLVLIERFDTGPGNFDIEFNYDRVQWESSVGGYVAHAGFSNGSGVAGTNFALPGSGVSGAFVDGGPTSTRLIQNHFHSAVDGRYAFHARSGIIDTTNQAPIAEAGGPYAVPAGANITLNGAGSRDPDGALVSYEWDYDYDGVNFTVDAIGATPAFAASSLVGTQRTVALRVTDDGGASSIDVATVNLITPNNTPKVLNPGTAGIQELGRFGYSTATDGRYCIVGDPYANAPGAQYAGAVYVFSVATGARVATLANPAPQYQDLFGWSVAVSGNNVFVGVLADHLRSGQVFVFDVATGNLKGDLVNPAPSSDDAFGYSLSASGNTAVVGASRVEGSGRAYVYNATTRALIVTLAKPNPTYRDGFGCDVSVSGNTVVVGSLHESSVAYESGRAYVFNATTGALVHTLAHPNPRVGDYFGFSVSVSQNRIAVGTTPNSADGSHPNGRVYLFDATTGTLLTTFVSPNNRNRFGCDVALSENTLVVGAPREDLGVGRAYVFNVTTGSLIATLDNPSPASSGEFGRTVAVSGTAIIVGAPGDDFQNPVGQGMAYGYSNIPPRIVSVDINGGLGGAQRSRVVDIRVVFDQPVQLDANAMALALHANVRFDGVLRPAGCGTLPAALILSANDNITWTVTFAGNTDPTAPPADGLHSLRDGVYDFTIDAAKVHPLGAPSINGAGNSTTVFHRLFGNVTAPTTPPGGTTGVDFSATVNSGDNLQFRACFNNPANYQARFDFNGDGVINSADNLQFRNRFNRALTWSV